MNVRPRLLLSSFLSAKTGLSKKTKPPNHYETLEINSRATQGEIKSAYFKLSKQYHPDKNDSEAATAKFREVAEAYEVLGNYNSRKTYDRSILTHTDSHRPVAKDGAKPDDPNIKYYQSQAALYRQATMAGSTPLYDFEAWTKAHYGNTLDRTLRDRKKASLKRQERAQDANLGSVSNFGVIFFAFSFVTALVLMGMSTKTDFDQALTIRQRNELDGVDESKGNVKGSAVDLLSSK